MRAEGIATLYGPFPRIDGGEFTAIVRMQCFARMCKAKNAWKRVGRATITIQSFIRMAKTAQNLEQQRTLTESGPICAQDEETFVGSATRCSDDQHNIDAYLAAQVNPLVARLLRYLFDQSRSKVQQGNIHYLALRFFTMEASACEEARCTVEVKPPTSSQRAEPYRVGIEIQDVQPLLERLIRRVMDEQPTNRYDVINCFVTELDSLSLDFAKAN